MALPTTTLDPTKKTNLPYTQPGQLTQTMPTQQPQQSMQPTAQAPTPMQPQPIQAPTVPQDQLNQQVLQTGQRAAIQGYQSPTQQLTSQRTQELLQQQQGPQQIQQAVQSTMEEYDRARANEFERYRQAMGGQAALGLAQEDLLNVALAGGQERAALERQTARDEEQRQMQNLIAAIGQGRETSGQEAKQYNDYISNLANMRQAAEGEAQREFQGAQAAIDRGMQFASQINDQGFQMALMELKGKIDSGMQLQAQDFQRVQSELDRNLQIAMQTKDIDAQRELLSTQLAFNREEAALGRQFTREESALNRALELSLQINDQQFQEHLLGVKEKIDLNMMLTEQEFESIQNDYNRQLQLAMQNNDIVAQQELQASMNEFNAVQNDLQRNFEFDLQQRQFSQDQWMQNRAEAMQQAGFDQQSAMQIAEFQQRQWEAEYDANLQKYLQQGMQQFEAEQMAAEQAWRSEEATFDRQLQRELEAGRITLEQLKMNQDYNMFVAELVQSGQQFDQQIALERYATERGLNLEEARMIQESSERALDRAHEANMQALRIEFERQGLNFQAFWNNLDSLPEDQVADAISQAAENVGMTYTVTDPETGQTTTMPGLRPVAESTRTQRATIDAWKTVSAGGTIDVQQASDILAAAKAGTSGVEVLDMRTAFGMTGDITNRYRDGVTGERDRWALIPDVKTAVQANKGKFVEVNGRLYQIEGAETHSQDRNSTEYILLRDVTTGTILQYASGDGGGNYKALPTGGYNIGGNQ